jgi:phosphoglycerate dehydrogenase-like enzyme
MHRLLILSRRAGEYRQLLEAAKLPEIEIHSSTEVTQASAIGSDFEIVYGEPRLIRDMLPKLRSLRWVQTTSAGIELLLNSNLRRDYILTNAREVFGALMSEYVFAYLLLHERQIFERYKAQREHRWDGSDTGSLRGKTIGLLGVGSIGSRLARTAKQFEMKVQGYTRGSQTTSDVDVYFHPPELLAFAQGLDYLVSVLPNTTETQRIVDASLLNGLPAHAIFINVGRGSAVDEPALVRALQEKRIAAAVLDVYQEEPLPKRHPFWRTKNLLLTFHTSAPSLPADLAGLFIENYGRYLRGEKLNYEVDFVRGY